MLWFKLSTSNARKLDTRPLLFNLLTILLLRGNDPMRSQLAAIVVEVTTLRAPVVAVGVAVGGEAIRSGPDGDYLSQRIVKYCLVYLTCI